MADMPVISDTQLAIEVWRSGRRSQYFRRHPLTFPTVMKRQLLLSLGVTRAEVDKGFADPAALRRFARAAADGAAAFSDSHDGEYIADGENASFLRASDYGLACFGGIRRNHGSAQSVRKEQEDLFLFKDRDWEASVEAVL